MVIKAVLLASETFDARWVYLRRLDHAFLHLLVQLCQVRYQVRLFSQLVRVPEVIHHMLAFDEAVKLTVQRLVRPAAAEFV